MSSLKSSFASLLLLGFALIQLSIRCQALNKYSAEANAASNGGQKDEERPYRMQKINLLFNKAKQKLSGQKLKNLMSDLKAQDKDEVTLKKLRSEGGDKNGLKEAELRKRLNLIINKYGLSEHFDLKLDNDIDPRGANGTDEYLQKQLFRDKKLDKLWQKAEKSGFTEEQLKMLSEEFKHHQEKIEQYHRLINEVDLKEERIKSKGENWDNSVEKLVDGEELRRAGGVLNAHQALKEKHQKLKEGYHQLKNKVVGGPGDAAGQDFEEVKVQALWEMAQKADFTKEELDSLRDELKHYQHRIKKAQYLEEQYENDHMLGKYREENDGEEGGTKHLKHRVKEIKYKVDKIHKELETRIMQRHLEL